MNRFLNFFSIISVAFITFQFTPLAFAHPGGGPPFLKVNGVYAETDSYSPLLEDIAATAFTRSDTISFEIDTSKLGVPADIIEQSEFRWKFEGEEEVLFGTSITKQYSKIGSHIITIEVKAPNDPNFFTLDTIRINIVSDLSYQLPLTKVRIIARDDKSTSKVTFEPMVTTDPKSTVDSYVWTLGDGTIKKEKMPTHAYVGSNYAYLVSVRVTDSNGFFTYGGVVANAINGKRAFDDPFTGGKSFEVTFPKSLSPQKKALSTNQFFIPAGIIFLGIIIFIALQMRKK